MIYGVILAGGKGKRFGEPKQFMKVEGKRLIDFSIETFLKVVDCLIVVVDKEHLNFIQSSDKVKVILGGKERGDSLKCAIDYLSDKASFDDIVVTHDAARPFVSVDTINRSVELAKIYGASSVGLKVCDTVVKVEGENVVGSIDRESIMTVQTPQTAKFGLLKDVQNASLYTDLCTMLLSKGINVKVFDGIDDNIKVTYPDDIKKIFKILNNKY